MKRTTIPILATTFVLTLSCSPKVTILEEPSVPENPTPQTEMSDGKVIKLSDNMVSISPLIGKYTITVGQEIYYSANVHGSVGSSASASSTDEEVLAFVSREFEYEDEKRAEMPGGDAGTTTFVFKAVTPGTATVIVQHMFRGELENEYEIVINVVE